MLSHCAPLFFLPHPDAAGDKIFANGTASLLNTGQKSLLVTCAHVWTAFKQYQELHGPSAVLATVFRNGRSKPIVISPSSLIDCGESLLDIAVFEAKPAEWDMSFKEFFRIHRWPIPKVRANDIVSFVGFAGEHRRGSADGCFFDYAMFGNGVTDVSTFQFILSEVGETTNNAGEIISPIDMGGMSGSPVFYRRGDHFDFRGILSAETSFGRKVTHAYFLQADGRLHRD
jgi:hypothetical protein